MRYFKVKGFGELKNIPTGTTYPTRRGPREFAFVLFWWNSRIHCTWNHRRKGAFVSGGENVSLKVGMRIDPELKGIRNSEELAYFSRNTVQISKETSPDQYESYFKFLQLLLIQKPDDVLNHQLPLQCVQGGCKRNLISQICKGAFLSKI